MLVVKLGGSIAVRGIDKLKAVLEELEVAENVLVVPGGWVFADIVRLVDYYHSMPKASHVLGVLSMEMYAYLISELSGFKLTTLQELSAGKKGKFVLLPYSSKLYKELPESWEVTSDSFAVLVAHRVGCREVLKVTDVDGILDGNKLLPEVKAGELKGETCLDSYSAKLIERLGVRVFICNGLKRGRVKGYIVEGRTPGTLVY